jgi:hypothetical protein
LDTLGDEKVRKAWEKELDNMYYLKYEISKSDVKEGIEYSKKEHYLECGRLDDV